MAVSFTQGNDFIVPSEDGQTYLGGAGSDTYILSPGSIQEDATSVISDTEGSNKIQLVSGLEITSSQVFSDAVELTLANGAKIQVLGAAGFEFEIGGNVLDGESGTVVGFESFVTNVLETTVPGPGEDPSQGGTVYIGDPPPIENPGDTFTLTEIEDIPAETEPVLMWGYTPNEEREDGSQNNSEASQGIPADELISFLNDINIDLVELGVIDDDGVDPNDVIENITIGDVNTSGDSNTITFDTIAGLTISAEAYLGEQYLNFLSDLIFDADGNSRLYMVDEVTQEAIEGQAIVLTPSENNGGTIEEGGLTTNADDTIVAGRLELLHGAYIDGGDGHDILEVDAKGVFAQPVELLNIEEVRVQNLPNVYTDGSDESTYPEVSGDGPDNSILDLSRATSLHRLVVTEGDFADLGDAGDLGTLTIAGIRNGAWTTLDGGFSEDVTLHYSDASQWGITLEFNNLSMEDDAQLKVAHNADTMNIDSFGASNYINNADFGGSLSNLNIFGNAHLYIEGDLDASFHDGSPVTIDASENFGGVNLNLTASQNVTFLGTSADDRFSVTTSDSDAYPTNDESVDIIGGEGNNYYEVTGAETVTITNGDGDNNYEINDTWALRAVNQLSITTGHGDNHFEVDGVAEAILTAGDGNNRFDILTDSSYDYLGINGPDFAPVLTIEAGSGENVINVGNQDGFSLPAEVNITVGDGGNTMFVQSETINVTAGAGDDTLILVNGNNSVETFEEDTALINIDLGAGQNSLQLGVDDNQDGITDDLGIIALEGSSITGENITLYVEQASDLQAADLDGIVSVVLDNDIVGDNGGTPALVLTDVQFAEIGAENFSVEGATFNTYAQVHIVVTQDTSLTDLGVDNLPRGIDLTLEIQDDVTLEMTAEQLHEKVAPEGVTISDDGNFDDISGSVLITGAGLDFDPFNNNDQVRTEIDGKEYIGGSLATGEFGFATDNDTPEDGIQRDEWGSNVLLDRTMNGYNRPADAPSYSRLVIDTDEVSEIGPFATIETFLSIVGDSDLTFTPVESGIDDWGRPIEGGTAIELGVDTGPDPDENNDFIIDFSSVGGSVNNLTVARFEDAEEIYGNGSETIDARLNVELTGDVASEDAGLFSRGVHTYVVTDLNDDDREFWTSSVTEDLETLGLQGNYGHAITFGNTERGVEFLMEVAYDKFDGYSVGELIGEFARIEANAVVNVVGLDALPAGEVQIVEGITLGNSSSVEINVTGGDTVIESFSGDKAETFTFTADADLTVDVSFIVEGVTEVVDGNGVAGDFNITVSGKVDLSDVDMLGMDQIILENGANVTMSAEQLELLGDMIVTEDGATTTLNVVDLSDEALDLSDIDVTNIGSVTFADVDGDILVDAATDFGGADSLNILAEDSDTNVQMTVAQLETTADNTVVMEEAADTDGNLTLTEVPNNDEIDLSNVSATGGDVIADVNLVGSDFVSTEDFLLTDANGAGNSADLNLTATLTGVNDITATPVANLTDLDELVLEDGATMTMTAAQLEVLYTENDELTIADGANVTLNITDLAGQELDLDALVADNPGLNIGTVAIENTDAGINIHAGTTFGGADEIITPTADVAAPEWGTEQTSVTMTVDQFDSSAGLISGDAQINLTDLYNNVDTDGDFIPDSANFDLSGIGNAGTIEFATDTQGGVADDQHFITLTEDANLGEFEITFTRDGELIRFATEDQADAEITVGGMEVSITGVQWLWTEFGAEVDTSGYDGDITTLFIDEALLDSQPREEDLWTELPGSIVVEKINGSVIPELIKYERINTFEAFTNLVDGINYDDDAEFSTVADLIMNLEGEVNIGDILLGDTNNGDGSTPNIDDQGFFNSLTINSYLDLSNNDEYDDSNPNILPGRVIEANYLGDISLNAGSVDELVDITINTYGDGSEADPNDGQYSDPVNVNGPFALRDGLAIETGTITFEAEEADSWATLTVTGAEDVTIEGVDLSNDNVDVLHIDMFDTAATFDGTLTIGGIDYTDFDEDGDPTTAGMDMDNVYMLDDYAGADTFGSASGNDLIEVVDGIIDLTDADVTDVDALYVSGDATITMTAAQIAAIGEEDFTLATGVNVTVNVTEVGAAEIDLDILEDAGFNIGTVTVVEDGVILNAGTTLGGADDMVILTDDDATDDGVAMTAAQYQSFSGVITEGGTESAYVTITDLDGIATDTDGDGTVDTADIDLSTIATTGAHRLELADVGDAADLTIADTADLAGFTVVLDSQGSVLNDLAGQTVRFSTAVQAERAIDVINDSGAADNGTNVVWLFDEITGTEEAGKVDTANYDSDLGRVWMLESLVSDQNVEELFTSLADSIIIRVVNEDDLDSLLFTDGFDRHVEIETFTTLGDLTFTDIDESGQPLDFVQELDIDLGGEVTMGDITVSNILADPIDNDDEFDVLTINSYLASVGSGAEYLLPEGYDYGPGNGQVPYPTGTNTIGDIQSGSDDFDMGAVVINTNNPTSGNNDLVVGTIYFSDDGDGLTGTATGSTAEFEVNGAGTVTVKSLDTTDPDITALTVDNNLTGGAAALITGGSPAFGGGAAAGNTETLTIEAGENSVTTFGSAKAAPATGEWAGIYGETLSLIDINGTGEVNLGIIAGVDSEDFTLDGTGSTGNVSFTMGEADANGLTAPELDAAGVWTFEFAADATVDMTLTEDVVLNAGGTLSITEVDTLNIDGNVDLSDLDLTLTNVGNISVSTGNSLTMTAEQADGLTVSGAGTLYLVGDQDLSGDDYDLDQLTIENIDLTGMTSDTELDLSAHSTDYNIIGSDQVDTITTGSGDDVIDGGAGDDFLTGGAGNDALNGGSGDDILFGGDGDDILTGGAGDDTMTGGNGDDTFNVDQGTDTVTDLGVDSGASDVLVVSNGATVNADVIEDWAADIETDNAGTANLFLGDSIDVDLSDATDTTNGFNISAVGNANGSEIIGSVQADTITGGDGFDTIVGFVGADSVDGGGGINSLVLDGTSADLNAAADDDLQNVLEIDLDHADYYPTAGVDLDLSNQSDGFDIRGSDYSDTIVGSTGNDTIMGGSGTDNVLTGGSGDDTFYTSDGDEVTDLGGDNSDADVLDVAAGTTSSVTATVTSDFTATGDTENNAIGGAGLAILNVNNDVDVDLSGASAIGDGFTVDADGNAAASTLIGSQGNDIIIGGDADDSITGGLGDDTLIGNAGNDTFNVVGGTDTIEDLSGSDVLFVDGANASATVTADFTATADTENNAGLAFLYLEDGVDADLSAATVNTVATDGYSISADGNTSASSIVGSAGDDFLTGGDGNDSLTGGAGADIINGGDGDDSIFGFDETGGGGLAEQIDGGSGDDTLYLDATSADLNAAVDVDVVSIENVNLAAAAAGVLLNLDNQLEGFNITGSDFGDTITGGSGADTISAGSGDDTIIGFDVADDTVDGGAGDDTLVLDADLVLDAASTRNNSALVDLENIDMSAATSVDLSTQDDGFNVIGYASGDTLVGSTGDDTLVVESDLDLTAGAGDANLQDVENISLETSSAPGLTLNASNQTEDLNITGSDFNDNITGGSGNDTITGGSGDDTIDVVLNAGDDTVVVDFGTDTVNNFQDGDILVVDTGATANVTIVDTSFDGGSSTNNGTVNVTAGAGWLNIDVSTSAGTGSWDITGTGASEVIWGSQNDDVLTGLGGNDSINGGSGADTITGGDGADNLTGGAGADIFNYTALTEGGDVIVDFNETEGDVFNFAASAFAWGHDVATLSTAATAAATTFLTGANKTALTVAGIGSASGGNTGNKFGVFGLDTVAEVLYYFAGSWTGGVATGNINITNTVTIVATLGLENNDPVAADIVLV